MMFLISASVQLQCDKRHIKATIGEELNIACSFDPVHRFNKKYWCRGSSRNTCEELAHSENVAHTESKRFRVLSYKRKIYVKMTALGLGDVGVYWVGIDRPFADIMVSVTVEVTEVPVSKPVIWPLVPLARTCWGHPVTVRCGCTQGSSVGFTWYQPTQRQKASLHSPSASDLRLDCGNVEGGGHFYCNASNTISSQTSSLSVEVLVLAAVNCSYVIHIQDQPTYRCVLARPTPPVPPDGTPKYTQMSMSEVIHQTDQPMDHSTPTRFPLWYSVLRWTLFAILMIWLCAIRVAHPK